MTSIFTANPIETSSSLKVKFVGCQSVYDLHQLSLEQQKEFGRFLLDALPVNSNYGFLCEALSDLNWADVAEDTFQAISGGVLNDVLVDGVGRANNQPFRFSCWLEFIYTALSSFGNYWETAGLFDDHKKFFAAQYKNQIVNNFPGFSNLGYETSFYDYRSQRILERKILLDCLDNDGKTHFLILQERYFENAVNNSFYKKSVSIKLCNIPNFSSSWFMGATNAKRNYLLHDQLENFEVTSISVKTSSAVTAITREVSPTFTRTLVSAYGDKVISPIEMEPLVVPVLRHEQTWYESEKENRFTQEKHSSGEVEKLLIVDGQFTQLTVNSGSAVYNKRVAGIANITADEVKSGLIKDGEEVMLFSSAINNGITSTYKNLLSGEEGTFSNMFNRIRFDIDHNPFSNVPDYFRQFYYVSLGHGGFYWDVEKASIPFKYQGRDTVLNVFSQGEKLLAFIGGLEELPSAGAIIVCDTEQDKVSYTPDDLVKLCLENNKHSIVFSLVSLNNGDSLQELRLVTVGSRTASVPEDFVKFLSDSALELLPNKATTKDDDDKITAKHFAKNYGENHRSIDFHKVHETISDSLDSILGNSADEQPYHQHCCLLNSSWSRMKIESPKSLISEPQQESGVDSATTDSVPEVQPKEENK